jgi:hypothetical protein
VAQVVLAPVLRHVASHALLEQARRQAQHPHAVARQLLGEGPRHARDRRLARAVVDGGVQDALARERADVEDGALLAPDHGPRGRSRGEVGPLDVDVHHLVEVLLLEQGQRQVLGDGGVVDEHVEPSPLALDLGEHGRGAGGIQHRAAERPGRTELGQLRQRLVGCRLVSGPGERDLAAPAGQRERDGATEPAASARDQRDHFDLPQISEGRAAGAKRVSRPR